MFLKGGSILGVPLGGKHPRVWFLQEEEEKMAVLVEMN